MRHRGHPIVAIQYRNSQRLDILITTIASSRRSGCVGHVSSRRSASNIYIRNNKFTIIHHRDNQSSHIYHRRQSHSTIHIRNNQPSLDHSFRAPEPPSASIAAIAASPCRTTIHSAPPSPRTLDASLIGRPRIPKALPPDNDSHYRNEHIWLMSNRLNI